MIMPAALTRSVPAPSARADSIVPAALQLFAARGYRRTSVDDIARAAHVAKRTVYQHYDSKAAIFLAMIDHLAELILGRCEEAMTKPLSPVERLTALLDAYHGTLFEYFGASEYVEDLEVANAELTQERTSKFAADYTARMVEFLREQQTAGVIGRPPKGFTLPQLARFLMRSAAGARRDRTFRGDARSFRSYLRELALLTWAAVCKHEE